MADEAGGAGRIVVGVDGSEPSREALRWAVRQASLTGATVDAVMTWEYPTVYGWAPTTIDVDLEGAARTELAKTVDEALGDTSAVRQKVVEGNAATVLLSESKGAELLVVGNRGHGGFTEALLGSVGQHVTQHATCPVVIVRDGA